jgi:inner membrane protein
LYRLNAGEFGVSLVVPVDLYRQATRTTKYALMFIAFTFIAFFLIEMLDRVSVHPVQYLMVGLALVLFYSLEISLAEHVGFDLGYLIASIATVVLIALYAKAMFGSARMATWIAGVLTILYGFLYLVLQLEDYALLVGSVALFATLAALMYFTRRIDWYGAVSGPNS